MTVGESLCKSVWMWVCIYTVLKYDVCMSLATLKKELLPLSFFTLSFIAEVFCICPGCWHDAFSMTNKITPVISVLNIEENTATSTNLIKTLIYRVNDIRCVDSAAVWQCCVRFLPLCFSLLCSWMWIFYECSCSFFPTLFDCMPAWSIYF